MMGISSFLNSKLLYKCCVLSRINKILFLPSDVILARYFSMEKGLFDYQKQSHLKLLVCGHTVQTIFLKTEIFSG